MSYRVVEVNGVPVLAWGTKPVTVTADDALAPEDSKQSARAQKRQEVENWLRNLLADGAMTVNDIDDRAKVARHSRYAVRAAKEDIGIIPFRQFWTRSRLVLAASGHRSRKRCLSRRQRTYGFYGGRPRP